MNMTLLRIWRPVLNILDYCLYLGLFLLQIHLLPLSSEKTYGSYFRRYIFIVNGVFIR